MALSKYKRDEHDLFNEIMGFSPSNKTETPSAVVSDLSALERWERIKNKSDSMPTYDTTRYEDTDKGGAAAQAYKDALDAVNGYESFDFSNQAEIDNIMKDILERKPFNYNFNEDAFYQMYKDVYQKQGKMAAANVIGQAAALTGGYGNSYAATAGNQAYLGHLENLNDIIPELYQMAYDKYSGEGRELLNRYESLNNERTKEYADYTDSYSRLLDNLSAAEKDYNSGASEYYASQANKNSAAHSEFEDKQLLLKEPTEDAPNFKLSEWTSILQDADKYAQKGEDSLYFYLQTLIDQYDLSVEDAGDILMHYFPQI